MQNYSVSGQRVNLILAVSFFVSFFLFLFFFLVFNKQTASSAQSSAHARTRHAMLFINSLPTSVVC